jgi:predicted kinase
MLTWCGFLVISTLPDQELRADLIEVFWMTQPRLIIITGAPCTGKTQLGKWLAQEFSLLFINKDGIKELLFNCLGWKDRDWSKTMSLASYDLLYYFAEAQLAAKQQIIVEANFRTGIDSPKMMHLVAKYQYHPIQFHCYADERVLVERFHNRATSTDRHPGHVDHLTLKELNASLELGEYQPLVIPGSVIEVDTTDFSKINYQNLAQEFRDLLSQP